MPTSFYASDETSERFWPVYGRVSRQADACGNLVPDAHLVALMVENGVRTIWTHDRDYSTPSSHRVRLSAGSHGIALSVRMQRCAALYR